MPLSLHTILYILRHPLATLKFLYTFNTQVALLLLKRALLPFLPRYQTLWQQIRRAYLLSAGTEMVHRLPANYSQKRARLVTGVGETGKWKGYVVPGRRELKDFTEGELAKGVEGADGAKKVVALYAHGGGYGWGEARMYVNYFERWVRRGKEEGVELVVVSVEYPLTSEAPHPAQLNAFIAAYKDLLSQGISPKQIVFMGDSAGGGLSVLSGIECIRQQLPQPAASILISPWMDFSMRAYEGGNALVETDFVASANEIVPILGDAFIGSSGYTRTSPEVNPLYLDPNFVKGLNPQLIFVGAAEFCIADSKDWADICRKGLVEHDLVVERGELHIYAMGSKWLTHAVREKTDQKMFGWMKKYVG